MYGSADSKDKGKKKSTRDHERILSVTGDRRSALDRHLFTSRPLAIRGFCSRTAVHHDGPRGSTAGRLWRAYSMASAITMIARVSSDKVGRTGRLTARSSASGGRHCADRPQGARHVWSRTTPAGAGVHAFRTAPVAPFVTSIKDPRRLQRFDGHPCWCTGLPACIGTDLWQKVCRWLRCDELFRADAGIQAALLPPPSPASLYSATSPHHRSEYVGQAVPGPASSARWTANPTAHALRQPAMLADLRHHLDERGFIEGNHRVRATVFIEKPASSAYTCLPQRHACGNEARSVSGF